MLLVNHLLRSYPLPLGPHCIAALLERLRLGGDKLSTQAPKIVPGAVSAHSGFAAAALGSAPYTFKSPLCFFPDGVHCRR